MCTMSGCGSTAMLTQFSVGFDEMVGPNPLRNLVLSYANVRIGDLVATMS